MHEFIRWTGYVNIRVYWSLMIGCSPFIIKSGKCRHFFFSWYDVLISCDADFFYVCKIYSTGGSLLT
jgi:hypothetical protein